MNPETVRKAFKFATVSGAVLVALAGTELYRGVAYKPTPDDRWTLGYGQTVGVKRGMKTTPERALLNLYTTAQGTYVDGLKACVTGEVNDSEIASLIMGAYNMGVKGQCASPMVKAINEGRYADVCKANIGYRETVGGKSCRNKRNNCFGVVVRRQLESDICNDKNRGNDQ